jgi:hypothetical protein
MKNPSRTTSPSCINLRRLPHTTKDSAAEIPRDHPSVPIAGLLVRDTPEDETSRLYIEQFNNAVIRAARALYGDTPRENLWKAYLSAKQNIPSFLRLIPDGAWKNLWKSQCSCRPTDSARLGNMMILVEDMSSIGRISAKYHDILRLEQVFANGDQEEALRLWLMRNPIGKSSEPTPTNLSLDQWERQLTKKGFDKEWLELGTRLYAAAGKLKQSHRIMVDLSKRFRCTDPRFAIYVILYLVSTKQPFNIGRAWVDFLRLLSHEKFTISTDDFDLLLKAFLGVKRYDHAAAIVCSAIKVHGKNPKKHLPVFRDMVHELLASCPTSAEVNKAALMVMGLVPKGPPATYFFGTFMSRIHQTGDPNQIAHLIELMFESGVKPKSWHFNSLLEFSFSGSLEQKQGASKIALNMIEKQFSGANNHKIDTTSITETTKTINWIPNFLRREIPPAGGRVYVELLKYFARRDQDMSTTYIMQLLNHYSPESMSDTNIRSILSLHVMVGDLEGAWTFFEHVINRKLMVVDYRCYSIMWRALLTNLSTAQRSRHSQYPSPRALFGHMVTHMMIEKSFTQILLQDSFPRALYERIIKCFCVANDTLGVFIALEQLNATFGTLPTIRTIKNVVHHITIRHGFRNTENDASYIPWVENMQLSLKTLESAFIEMQPNAPSLAGQKAQFTRESLLQLDETTSGKDILQLLSSLIQTAAALLDKGHTWTQTSIDQVKDEMGAVEQA